MPSERCSPSSLYLLSYQRWILSSVCCLDQRTGIGATGLRGYPAHCQRDQHKGAMSKDMTKLSRVSREFVALRDNFLHRINDNKKREKASGQFATFFTFFAQGERRQNRQRVSRQSSTSSARQQCSGLFRGGSEHPLSQVEIE